MDAPVFVFPGGPAVRQVRGDTWEWVDLLGAHVAYIVAEDVTYESSIAAENLKSRSFKQ